jgi:hypothetical protein
MKKTYMIPTLQVVKIQTTNLLQTVSMYGKDAEGTGMARRGRFSDWEEVGE